MRVRFRSLAVDASLSNEAGYISRGQIFLSPGKSYEVYVVSVYDGVVFMQVVDDLETPIFLPRTLFEVVDSQVPQDWICNAFPGGPVQLVLGPTFVAEGLGSYEAMIDQRRPQVEKFWRRVDSLRGTKNE